MQDFDTFEMFEEEQAEQMHDVLMSWGGTSTNAMIDMKSFDYNWYKEGFVKACEELLKEWGFDFEIRESYSGRGMFGKSVRAIVGHEESKDLLRDLVEIHGCRWDNMGYGIVVY